MDGGGGDDVMGMDDDEDRHRIKSKDDSLRLSLSRDDSNRSGGGAAGISFGEEDDDDEASADAKKRKSDDSEDEEDDAPKKKTKKKKKRKVITDLGRTELTSEHIRRMIADTSRIVRPQIHPATWVPGQRSSLARYRPPAAPRVPDGRAAADASRAGRRRTAGAGTDCAVGPQRGAHSRTAGAVPAAP